MTKLFSQAARVLALVLIVVNLQAAEPSAGVNPSQLESAAKRWSTGGAGGTPSFTKHVVPLFSKMGCNMRECHGSFQGQNGFRLSLFGYDPDMDYHELTADEGGPRLEVKDVDASLVLNKPLGKLDHGGGQIFTTGSWQYRVLKEWIAAGAKYDRKKDAKLEELIFRPKEILFADNKPVQLQVAARFSDGTVEDVRQMTTFSTNDEAVATVSETGEIAPAGMGDTAIVVSFGGGVETCQVIVPRQTKQTFPNFPQHNPVDRFVKAKLYKLGIQPSPLCSDEVFVRRVYVDTIGTLPTAEEVREFLADKTPGKRGRLIDELLDRPEYGMYWATIFSDWTGNNTGNVNSWFKMVWLWHDWLREKLERNIPYDELVGGIVTATSREGRPLEEFLEENRAVHRRIKPRVGFDDGTYAKRKTLDLYWMKRTSDRPKELAIRTANAFLGVQIQCAQCHKHPFDRWTQHDFESWTSFFQAVKITDLDGSPRSKGRYDYHLVALYPGPSKRYARQVEKRPPKILGGPVVPFHEGQDPRVAMWEWMRSPDNYYFSRNIVNRLWEHYFGVGIVDPVDDLNAANPPSNPQLMTWLAQDFIEHDFDLKHLHRRILNSRTYQLSYVPNESNRTDRRNFSHAMVKRMPAEVALDAIVQITGTKLDFKTYSTRPGTRCIGLAPPVRYGAGEYFMKTFGRPERVQTCACERSSSPGLTQALYLMNDSEIHSRISDADGMLAQLLAEIPDDRKLIEELYLMCLARYPRAKEVAKIEAYLAKTGSRQDALEDVLWSLINVREFLFVR